MRKVNDKELYDRAHAAANCVQTMLDKAAEFRSLLKDGLSYEEHRAVRYKSAASLDVLRDHRTMTEIELLEEIAAASQLLTKVAAMYERHLDGFENG